MSSDTAVIPGITKIAGPLLLGYAFNWGAFGILCIQFYLYLRVFKKDSAFIRSLVYIVFALEAAQTLLLTETAFRSFVTGFLDQSSLDEIGTLWFSIAVIGGLVTSITQSFYAYRIRLLGRSIYVTGFIVVISVAQLVGALALAVEMKRAGLFSQFMTSTVGLSAAVWNGCGALCDVVIAAWMLYYLSRNQSEFRQTQMIIQKLIRITIETSLLTATFALLNIALVFLPGETTYYQSCAAVVGKVYANSMFALLNNRMTFRNVEHPRKSTGTSLSFATVPVGQSFTGSHSYPPSSSQSQSTPPGL